MKYKVGVTGGIGSGKSTLCRYFGEMGIPLYNTDQRAKDIMISDKSVRDKIVNLFGEEAYVDGSLNRALLADQIFSNQELRESLNNIVHPAVRSDFAEWAERQGDVPYVMMECALLFGSNFDSFVDSSVAVLAPLEVRIPRVMSRDSVTEEQVRARIATQLSDDELHKLATYSVVNIFEDDMEGSVKRLDQIFKQAAQRASSKE